MRRSALPLALAAALACTARPLPWDGATDGDATTDAATTDAATTDDLAPTTTAAPTTTSTTTGATTLPVDTSEPDMTDCGFICDDSTTATPGDHDCDGFIQPLQDCPEGQKCTFEDEFWNTHCVDVVDRPKGLYEPCQVLMGGWLSGFDDCGPALVCWDVDADTGVGTCIGLCGGNPPAEFTCADAWASCTWCQDCAMGLCLPSCDPLAQDCPNGDLCIAEPQGDGFLCVLDASGDEGQAFDPCEYANACDAGLLCVDPALAAECDPSMLGCCLPLCDLTAPVCPGPDLECLPWYEPGMAPEPFKNVGLCGLPQ